MSDCHHQCIACFPHLCEPVGWQARPRSLAQTVKVPMNRRQLLVSVLASAITAGLAVHTVARNAESPAVWLQEIYTRETERHNKQLPPDNDTLYALFSRELRELMQAPRLPNPREPAGPILHALFGRGVLPGTEVILSHVNTTRHEDSIAMLEVTLTVRGALRTLGIVLLRQEGSWRIHEIEYDGPDTLTAHYSRITGR
jgi:hypothetical protein